MNVATTTPRSAPATLAQAQQLFHRHWRTALDAHPRATPRSTPRRWWWPPRRCNSAAA